MVKKQLKLINNERTVVVALPLKASSCSGCDRAFFDICQFKDVAHCSPGVEDRCDYDYKSGCGYYSDYCETDWN